MACHIDGCFRQWAVGRVCRWRRKNHSWLPLMKNGGWGMRQARVGRQVELEIDMQVRMSGDVVLLTGWMPLFNRGEEGIK